MEGIYIQLKSEVGLLFPALQVPFPVCREPKQKSFVGCFLAGLRVEVLCIADDQDQPQLLLVPSQLCSGRMVARVPQLARAVEHSEGRNPEPRTTGACQSQLDQQTLQLDCLAEHPAPGPQSAQGQFTQCPCVSTSSSVK